MNRQELENATAGDKCAQPEATILIIDDNKELLWMLKDILSDEYAILTAENGEEGLALLKQETPDLIITDIMMPKVDGITLTKQIKSNKHTVHQHPISGNSDQAAYQKTKRVRTIL